MLTGSRGRRAPDGFNDSTPRGNSSTWLLQQS